MVQRKLCDSTTEVVIDTIFSLLDSVKESIKQYGSESVKERIDDIIDRDFISERIKANAWSFDDKLRMINGIFGIVNELCDPKNIKRFKDEQEELNRKFSKASDYWSGQYYLFANALQVIYNQVNLTRLYQTNKKYVCFYYMHILCI